MIVSLTPSLGALTGGALGAQKAYAAESISEDVYTSEMTEWADYTLSGNTKIHIDADLDVLSINVGGYDLTIEGDEEHTLGFQGISGDLGDVELKSGRLEADYAVTSGSYPAAINLTRGGFTMTGGDLYIDLDSTSETASTSYGINARTFTMTGGNATVYCLAEDSGYASAIASNDFTMTGGTLHATGETLVSGKSGSGIEAAGTGANADFLMTGGELDAEGLARDDDDSYGIYWSADASQNTFAVTGGKLKAGGARHGLISWVPVEVSGGADLTILSDRNTALYVDNAALSISGNNARVFAMTDFGTAAVEAETITLSDKILLLGPEGGSIGDHSGGWQTVYDENDDISGFALIGADTIPTELNINYDETKAFPTTRLTGHEVSLHLLRSVTTNPGKSEDGNGWYVFSADPEKADFEASPYTCLVRKTGSGYETLEDSDAKLNSTDEYYFCFNIEDNETKPFAAGRTYTVTVNAEPADEVVNYVDENGEGQLYVYKKVELDEAHDVAWSARVSPQGAKVTKGASRQFSAEVYCATNDSVTWSVSENESAGTYITSDGVLYAASDESASSVVVTATSVADPGISDSVYVEVVDYVPTIDSVEVRADSNPVCRGTGVWLHAAVEGTDIHDLTWEVIGSDGKSYFSQGSNLERLLFVAPGETASELTVRATSVADPTKYDEVTIQLKDKDIIQGPINLTFDGGGLSLTDEAGNLKTGKQVTKEFRNTITSPYGESLANKDAPGGWYIFGESGSSEPVSQYTSLVRKLDGYDFDDTLYQSTESLSADGEYYLWFNVEDCESTHQFDYAMDLANNITVNGMPVNGETVVAEWGGEINVYLRIVKEPGWIQVGDNWYYYNTCTTMAINKWQKKDGKWCYLGEDGSMVKNAWRKDSKGWCYLGEDGYMVTNDWVKDSKGWCWIASDGYMPVATKWLQYDGGWYHITKGYRDQSKWMKDSKGWCWLQEDGRMLTNGWAKDSKGWCWIGSNGYMVEQTKWIQAGSDWYHITKGYRDQSKWMKDSKGWCWLQADGKMLTNGWAKDSKGWCWIGVNGYMVEKTQWVKYEGVWYHITNGYRDANKWMKDSQGWCWLQADGSMLTNGWAKDSKGNCWIGEDGYMVEETKLIEFKGDTYGIENGYMVVGRTITIDGTEYTFGADGKLI